MVDHNCADRDLKFVQFVLYSSLAGYYLGYFFFCGGGGGGEELQYCSVCQLY